MIQAWHKMSPAGKVCEKWRIASSANVRPPTNSLGTSVLSVLFISKHSPTMPYIHIHQHAPASVGHRAVSQVFDVCRGGEEFAIAAEEMMSKK